MVGSPLILNRRSTGKRPGHNELGDAADMHRATRVIVRIVSAWADQATAVHSWPRVGF